ncbi:MAG: YcaO-like family protein [Archangiaceae bacterium]|nr:YcaO-like family protein [Archangiaceae bacterium]
MRHTAARFGLTVTAPCPHCVLGWLPAEGHELEVEPVQGARLDGEVTVCDDAGERFGASFFPHPDCLRHLPFEPAGLGALQAGALSPVARTWREPTDPGAPTLSGAELCGPHFGRGIDWDPQLSQLKAVMEALERDCAHRAPRVPLCWGEAGPRCAALPTAVEPGPRWWAEVPTLEGEAVHWLPLEYLQLASRCTVPRPVVAVDSTGLAAHLSRPAAVENGACEVAERHGLLQLWRARVPFVWAEPFPEKVARLAAVARARGFEVRFAAVAPAEGFVSCACFLYDGRWLVCGSGGGRTAEQAALRALTEAWSQLHQALTTEVPAPQAGLKRPYDHFAYYLSAEPARALLESWGVTGAPRRPFAALEPWAGGPAARWYVADRGNALTDYVQVAVVQVVAPLLPALAFDSEGVAPWPTPFG